MPGNPFLAAVASVRILELPFSADQCFDYAIPPALQNQVHPGTLTAVSFGNVHRRTAIVVSVKATSEYSRLKPLEAVADDRFSLNEELLGLCTFLRERTFCSTGEAVQTILPAGAVDSLYHSRRDPIERFYSLTGQKASRTGSAQAKVLAYLGEHPDRPVSLGELRKTLDVSLPTLKGLTEKGILREEIREVWRNPYAGRGRIPDPNRLSKEQADACERLAALAAEDQPRAALLYGVTGSGKTRVIKALIDRVIAMGKSVILLVPEISLTGQTVDLFCGYFGERVAVIHSGLSEGERTDAWKRIRAGEVDVVIGTRSAIFAPLDNLGLIVIDEEQEHTYKSDMNPKYHARDIARWRAAHNRALMLLASATPSLESFYKAKSGVYSLITLKERYGNAVLPEVRISDLRTDAQKGLITPIGGMLRDEIEKNLAAGEQTILFVSRRGYNNFVSCQKCGQAITCPHCSVSLTYHREADHAFLKCHYCGYTEEVPAQCPECASEHLSRKGFGTQLVAEELASLYPKARILRMDADATGGKFSHEAILSRFRAHEADILIGTQMVTKGHNFPDVTLVGVINTDAALYLDDFRASERTFALLTQVIGRAGRAQKPGRAVIQTCSPDNETINLAAAQDYEGFYESAIQLRRQLVFPPFCEFVLLGITGEAEQDVLALSLKLDKRLREFLSGEYSDLKIYLFGPFEAPIYKVNNVYRMRLILKCAVTKRVRGLIDRLMHEFSGSKTALKASVSADVNPGNL